MNEEIKFDKRHYESVVRYLNNHKELYKAAPFGIDGRLYLTNSKRPSGFVLQTCCGETNDAKLSVINNHPSFKKIKQDLGELLNGENE